MVFDALGGGLDYLDLDRADLAGGPSDLMAQVAGSADTGEQVITDNAVDEPTIDAAHTYHLSPCLNGGAYDAFVRGARVTYTQ